MNIQNAPPPPPTMMPMDPYSSYSLYDNNSAVQSMQPLSTFPSSSSSSSSGSSTTTIIIIVGLFIVLIGAGILAYFLFFKKKGITLTKPDPPTNVTVTAGDKSAVLYFAPPVKNGGSAITSYQATANPGGLTATSPDASPTITFTNLTNGTAYTFTVVAINTTGASDPSAPSIEVTPATRNPDPSPTPPDPHPGPTFPIAGLFWRHILTSVNHSWLSGSAQLSFGSIDVAPGITDTVKVTVYVVDVKLVGAIDALDNVKYKLSNGLELTGTFTAPSSLTIKYNNISVIGLITSDLRKINWNNGAVWDSFALSGLASQYKDVYNNVINVQLEGMMIQFKGPVVTLYAVAFDSDQILLIFGNEIIGGVLQPSKIVFVSGIATGIVWTAVS